MEIYRSHGLTLLELLIVLSIMGIIASVATPSFARWLQTIRIETVVATVERSIKLGRSEAVLRNQNVRICPSADSIACSATNDWSIGWIIYADIEGSSSREAGDPIVRIQARLDNVTIRYNRGHRVSFNSLGRISQNGSIWICDQAGHTQSIRLVMIHSGRIRREKESESCR